MARYYLNRLWILVVFVCFGFTLMVWRSETIGDDTNSISDITPKSKAAGGGGGVAVEYYDLSKGLQLPPVDDNTPPASEKETAAANNLLDAMAVVEIMTNRTHSSSAIGDNFTEDSPPDDQRSAVSTPPPFRWCHDNETMDEQISDDVRCDILFRGPGENETTAKEYDQARFRAKQWKPPCGDYSDKQVAELASKNCPLFLSSFNFNLGGPGGGGVPVSSEELSFPLAYVFVVQKWASQVVRVLSSVYRPHNVYCFTYDKHASINFKKAMKAATNCLRSNVFMSDRNFEIYWADISLLNATLNCMRILVDLRDRHDWRYVQILSYNDFPLRTNAEMVRILSQFRGANDVELTKAQTERYVHFYKYAEMDAVASKVARRIPPAGMVVYKGSFAATLSREFIHWVFADPNAARFLAWSVPTWAPEEQFWSSLVHNEHLNAPGRFPGSCLEYYRYGLVEKTWISRYQVWYSGCEGRYKSGSCIFGVGDLKTLIRRPELVAHKFYADYQPATFYCLAKRHYERTFVPERDWEFENPPAMPFNMTTYYEGLPAVMYQKLTNESAKAEFNCAVAFSKITSPV